ncbi:MAG: AraC family transcriptional regulator [Oliverpabstia sp.]
MKADDYYRYSYFKTPQPWAEKCLLVSDGMGYTADPDFRIDRRAFYNYLAFYIYKGTFYIEQYGKKYELHPGDTGIISLMDAHIYYSDATDVTHLLWFHFRGAGTGNIIEQLKQNESLPYLTHLPEMEQEFLKIFAMTAAGRSELELSGHMYGLIMKILQARPVTSWNSSKIPPVLQQTVRYMEEQAHASLTLEQLSAYAGMDKYHFSHIFKKWYGISPMQYYTGKKMEQACFLLLETDLSVDEIAEHLGYLDTGYFRKAFKNNFGITPTSYRRNRS